MNLNEEPYSDDPKYFYKNSKLLCNYIAILHACQIANIHLIVYGPPGAGKTSGTRAFGRIISKRPKERFDFEMHSFHAGTKPNHYYGTTTLKEGKIFYKNGALTNCLINGYILPHYKSDEEYSKLIDKTVEEYKDLNFIILTNEQAVIVDTRDNYKIVNTD